jgi:hypothetical protein
MVIVFWTSLVEIPIIDKDMNGSLFFSNQNDVRNPFRQGEMIDKARLQQFFNFFLYGYGFLRMNQAEFLSRDLMPG